MIGLSENRKAAAFLKKSGAKNFWLGWACGGDTSTAQINKVFSLLFFQKKKPSPLLEIALSCRNKISGADPWTRFSRRSTSSPPTWPPGASPAAS
jgi:hypothetical protein